MVRPNRYAVAASHINKRQEELRKIIAEAKEELAALTDAGFAVELCERDEARVRSLDPARIRLDARKALRKTKIPPECTLSEADEQEARREGELQEQVRGIMRELDEVRKRRSVFRRKVDVQRVAAAEAGLPSDIIVVTPKTPQKPN
jgi:hypothetical protein